MGIRIPMTVNLTVPSHIQEGLDGGSGIHYSLKIQPIVHLIKILGGPIIHLKQERWQRNLIIHYSLIFSSIH